MKTFSACLSVSVFSMICVSAANAQPPEGGRGFDPPGGGPDMMMRAMPVMAALDADKDGVISAEEISNAVAALKTVDKNSDGKLTEDELRPSFPGRDGGPGFGPPGEGSPGREGRRDGEGRGEDGAGGRGREGRGGNPEEMMSRIMQMDKDGDGKLAKDEVGERMQAMIERADIDKDGFATREELARVMLGGRGAGGGEGRPGEGQSGEGRGGERREGEGRGPGSGGPGAGAGGPQGFIDRMFEFDADKDGKLSREELSKMAEQFGGAGRGGFGGNPRPARPPQE